MNRFVSRFTRAAAALALLACASLASAQDIRLPDYQAVKLDNGGTLLLVPKKDVPMVAASVIVRGLRAVADFEYEYQMAGMNQQLNARIETVFLMAAVELQPIASKLVKEIALFGGDITRFVSPAVRADVLARVEQVGRLGDY